jgi:hypothetical protein
VTAKNNLGTELKTTVLGKIALSVYLKALTKNLALPHRWGRNFAALSPTNSGSDAGTTDRSQAVSRSSRGHKLVKLGIPDALKINEVTLHFDSRNCLQEMRGCTGEFALVMRGFRSSVAAKAARKASIGAAIGMYHQNHPSGPMQSHRLTDLFQHKLAVRLLLRGSQTLGAAGNLNGVGIDHTDALEELPESQLKSVIEAPEDGRVAMVLVARSVEVKQLSHDKPLLLHDHLCPSYLENR